MRYGKIAGGLLPSLIALGGIALAVTLVGLSRKWALGRRRRSPFTGDFLRNPGHSLLNQMDDLRHDLMGYLIAGMLMPLLMFSVLVTQAWFSQKPIKTGDWFVYGSILCVTFAYISVKLVKAVQHIQQLRLGYEGEMAVGQELNQLMRQGFRVYHDFPGDNFNIDHVVIGSTGVFAVETKARRKAATKDRRADSCIEYTGISLKFPSWQDNKTLEQAERQAQWLSRWLSSAVGEPVSVRATVAFPGWFVKQTGRGPVLVFSGKRPDAVFPKVDAKRLSETMVQRIAHQVEAKCRDVTPRAYKDELKKAS